jgi:hypothetical protein
MAMIVIPEAPVIQVNKAQVTKDAMAIPPGNLPIEVFSKLYSRCGALLSARIYPARVKRGMARRVGADASLFISRIITVGSVPADIKLIIEIKPRATKSGSPAEINNMVKIIIIVFIDHPILGYRNALRAF